MNLDTPSSARAACTKHGPLTSTICVACHDEHHQARTDRDFAAAKTKVPLAEYAGTWVTDGDEDFRQKAHALEIEPLTTSDGTRFLWGCEPRTPAVDFDRELDSWLEEHHESASDHVDFTKLKAAEALANEALAGVVTYFPDHAVAVILPPVEDDEERDPVNGQLVSATAGGAS